MESPGGFAEGLASALAGRAVVVGVGDERRGDDGVGPLIVRLLAETLPSLRRRGRGRLDVIDAGVSPEIETWRIREPAPESVLFVDAVDLKRAPGDVALLKPGDLRSEGFDTHRAPLRLTMEYIEAEIGATCRLLAVQPRDVRHGARMCPEVKRSAESLVTLISEVKHA